MYCHLTTTKIISYNYIDVEESSEVFDDAILVSKTPIRTLLLNDFGSILDERKISIDYFKALLIRIKQSKIKNVIFETHYNTIIIEKLKLIKDTLPETNID